MNNKQIITLIVVAVAAMAVGYFIGTGTSSGVKPESQITMKNQTDSLNYYLGLYWGYGLSEAPWEVDADMIASGFYQVIADSSSIDPMTAQQTFQNLTMALSEVENQRAEEDSFQTLEEGVAFLEENGRRENVVTTESGLQYEVVTLGDGPMPTEASTVSVFYEGTLIDGTIFDGNYDSGEPVSFPLGNVIAGWTEGLQLMPAGSTYMFYLPSNLAYGSRESGPIPANSTLIFKVELLEVK